MIKLLLKIIWQRRIVYYAGKQNPFFLCVCVHIFFGYYGNSNYRISGNTRKRYEKIHFRICIFSKS